MHFLHRLGAWLERRGRKHVILDREGNLPYLERHYLFFGKGRPNKPFNLLLHRILRSDNEDLHDHPWWFVSLILVGGYWEHMPGNKKHWRSAGSIAFRRSTDTHRIELEPGRAGVETWTLVLTGARRREWGFVFPDGTWMPWERYIEQLQASRKQ